VDCIIATNVAPLKGVPGRRSARSDWQWCDSFSTRLSENWSSRFFGTVCLAKDTPKHDNDFQFFAIAIIRLKHRWRLRAPKTNSLKRGVGEFT
jgi:hypothetical protein